ncbi:hypothetical protein ABN028_05840 [Actinopolymorpha sp. B17G11]
MPELNDGGSYVEARLVAVHGVREGSLGATNGGAYSRGTVRAGPLGICHSCGVMIPATGLLIDPRRRAWKGDAPRPITTYLWPPAGTPTGGTVVLSHGTGGSGLDLGWLAEQLAAAGLRVIAVDHHGNNYPSGYHAEGFVRW